MPTLPLRTMVAMRLKGQEAHQGIYNDKQWQVRLCVCGPVGLGAKAPVPASPAKPRRGSIPEGQPQDFLCWSCRWASAAQRTTEHSVKQGQHEQWEQRSAEGTVLGIDWGICCSAWRYLPQGLHRFSRKAQEKGQADSPGNCEANQACLPCHHMERSTGKMFLESFIGASASYSLGL